MGFMAAVLSLLPCGRRRRASPSVTAEAEPVASSVAVAQPEPEPEPECTVRGEGFIRFVGIWNKVDEVAVRAWMATSPPGMTPIPEESWMFEPWNR